MKLKWPRNSALSLANAIAAAFLGLFCNWRIVFVERKNTTQTVDVAWNGMTRRVKSRTLLCVYKSLISQGCSGCTQPHATLAADAVA
jgi:hypothetical protein